MCNYGYKWRITRPRGERETARRGGAPEIRYPGREQPTSTCRRRRARNHCLYWTRFCLFILSPSQILGREKYKSQKPISARTVGDAIPVISCYVALVATRGMNLQASSNALVISPFPPHDMMFLRPSKKVDNRLLDPAWLMRLVRMICG
jgi:hypothetical protein